ncbi:MAG TPA: phosphate ABC transporter permease subunit PstC, partial [Anaerolineae bacterium]|nr:phosphate ABC transporter permease subunit PstC [Anaerolineae bacterium]
TRLSIGDHTLKVLTIAMAMLVLMIMVFIAWQMMVASQPSLAKFGWSFVTGTTWDTVNIKLGALPFIYGTLVTSLLALILAVPTGLGLAVFLNEMAPSAIKTTVSFFAELLAAIPSVVYGLWGIFVLAPWLQSTIEPWLNRSFGFLPLFQGPPLGVGMLAGGLILAVMILPTITAISRDVMAVVPNTQREAALALGATRWEMVKMAVIPYAKSGIIGGVMLGLGRALGETMAITMVIGNRAQIVASLFAPANSLASVIANEFPEALSIHKNALMEIGLILFGISLMVNVLARILVWSVARGTKGGHVA